MRTPSVPDPAPSELGNVLSVLRLPWWCLEQRFGVQALVLDTQRGWEQCQQKKNKAGRALINLIKINSSISEKVQGSTKLAPSSPDLMASLWSSPHHGEALQWSGAEHGLGGLCQEGSVQAGCLRVGSAGDPTVLPLLSLCLLSRIKTW